MLDEDNKEVEFSELALSSVLKYLKLFWRCKKLTGHRSLSNAKKLIAVARYWAGDRGIESRIDSNVIDGLIMAGAPVEIIESYQQKLKQQQDTGCEIWQENLETFSVFQALTTQWRISDMGHFWPLLFFSRVGFKHDGL